MELLKSGAADESTLLRKAKFYDDKSIDRRAGLTVDAIDPDRRTVQLSDGSRHGYHRLVIATGSRARTLTVPGAGLPGARVSIIGAGYIGLEVAAAAARNCVAAVLEFKDRVMSRVTSEPVYRFFEQLHGQHGAPQRTPRCRRHRRGPERLPAPCHVFLEKEIFDTLAERSADELELLVEAEGYQECGLRHSCQLGFSQELNGATVTLAPEE